MARTIVIGRSDTCDVSIRNDTVSWRHASLTVLDNGRIEVSDLGSTNGTFVLRMGEKARIRSAVVDQGQVVMFGEYEAEVLELLRRATLPVEQAVPRGAVERVKVNSAPKEASRLSRCEHCGAVRPVGDICGACHRR